MRNKRYIWLPILLLAYGIAISIIFGKDWIAAGQSIRLYLSIGFDLLICILLFIYLRKKSRLNS